MKAIDKQNKKEVNCYKATNAPIGTGRWYYDALAYEGMSTTSDGRTIMESDWVVFNEDGSYKIIGENDFKRDY
jgi:hypothetical protein